MHTVAGKRLRFIPDRVIRRDPFPHLPVGRIDKFRTKSANPLVNLPLDHHCRSLKQHFGGYPLKPVRDNSGGAVERFWNMSALSSFVDDDVPAKGGSHVRILLYPSPELLVEPRQNHVILMEYVNPMAPRAFDAGIPIAAHPGAPRLFEDRYSVAGYSMHDILQVAVRRTIINDFNLHITSFGSLKQNASKSYFEESA